MSIKFFSVLFLVFVFGSGASAKSSCEIKPVNFSDSLEVKIYSKGNAIKLYTNAGTNGSNISSNQADNLHFYVFDLAGTLIHQATLKGSVKHTLPALKKGIYLYDVFKDDESIEDGRIVVK